MFDVDTEDVSHVVVHRVSKAAVAMLHTGLLDVVLEVSQSYLPVVSLFGYNYCSFIRPEFPVSD